jgi:hypothetical protein
MWMSTRKPRANTQQPTNDSENDETMAKGLSTSSSPDHNIKEEWQSSLPLDWTRMNERKRNANDDEKEDDCVNPANCLCRRRHVRPFANAAAMDTPGNSISLPSFRSTTTALHGQAIFCLHELDPAWVQGYFVPSGSNQPWGLLAVQEEIDDCLACSDGGYRRVGLTVYPPKPAAAATAAATQRKRRTIANIDWTGGDMMTLYHPDHVAMTAEQLLTGEKALPLLHKYFQGLLNRLQQEWNDNSADDESSILDWLPNVVVVKGSMKLVLPKENY